NGFRTACNLRVEPGSGELQQYRIVKREGNSHGQDFIIDLAGPFRHPPPTEDPRPGETTLDQFLTQLNVFGEPCDFLGNVFRVARLDIEGGVASNLRQGGSPGGNDWQSIGHRLEHRDPESL